MVKYLPNNYLILKTEQAQILCDPILNERTPLEKHDFIILTHLDFDTLDFMNNYRSSKPVYVSFELLKLIQKLTKVNLLKPVQLNLKVLPYKYAVKIGNISLTAFSNDDGQFGSMSILANGPHNTLGYCDSFYNHGNHKKRIKKWKKGFHEQNIDQLVLGSQIAPLNRSKNILSENGMQEMLTKFISKHKTKQPLTALLSPFDPERLYRYDKTAKTNQTPIIWDKNYWQILHSFYPFDDFFSVERLPEKNTNIIIQMEQSQQLKNSDTFFDPAVLHPYAVSTEGLIHQKPLCTLSQSELNEFISYIKPQQVVMKKDHSSDQNHLVPTNWLKSLTITM